jgi:hypothetical protein
LESNSINSRKSANPNKMYSLINFKSIPTKKFLLIDFIGATISTIMLCFVIPELNTYFGMPLRALYILGVFAGAFALCSISCYLIKIRDVSFILTLIATLNLSYCLSILILSIMYFKSLTDLGIIYFVLDILLVGSLAIIELKAAKRAMN